MPEPEVRMIDQGHRDDCQYCEGLPCAVVHDYVAPAGGRPNRPTRAAAEEVLSRFPGARLVDRPERDQGDYDLPDLDAGVRMPDVRPSSEDIVGKLLCLRPLGMVEVNGEHGLTTGTETYIVEVVEDAEEGAKPYIDRGKMPLLWQHVRAELARTTPGAPWTIGTITKRTKAYFLNAPTPARAKVAHAALVAFIEDRKGAAEGQPEPGQ